MVVSENFDLDAFIFYFAFLQEKQRSKVKEKFDKCNKEKLLEFCDVLDIPTSKTTRRKVCQFAAALARLFI